MSSKLKEQEPVGETYGSSIISALLTTNKMRSQMTLQSIHSETYGQNKNKELLAVAFATEDKKDSEQDKAMTML